MGNCTPNFWGPAEPGWDIAFTRLSRQVLHHVNACARELALRFESVGLTCHVDARQTPRGNSTVLAVVGQRGLLFIVDFTLVDAMVVARQAAAALDVRLLDANGDVAAKCIATEPLEPEGYHSTPAQVLEAARSGLSVPSLYLMALGRFDVLPKA